MIVDAIVSQGELKGDTLANAIAEALQGKQMDRLDVAVAYATRSGLAELEKASGGWPSATRWVVGLDDMITQPEAIASILEMENSEVRLASLSVGGRRFHPKLYCYWASTDPVACVAIIGSANMTLHGLERNGEIGVILRAESANEAEQLKASWAAMSALAKDAADWDLDAYNAAYAKARKARRRMDKAGAFPQPPEDIEPIPANGQFDGTASTAKVAWIDFGKAMGRGRELELHSEMMPFFGIGKNFPTPQERDFSFNGVRMSLPFKKWTGNKNNEMWRINFTADVPGSGVLIRPVVNGTQMRSDKAVVFERLDDGGFAVSFLAQANAGYVDLISLTKEQGYFGQTTARSYGFY